jgi:F-type H+-transporting ATPase subunit a
MVETILHHLKDSTYMTLGSLGSIQFLLTKQTVVMWIAAVITLLLVGYVGLLYRRNLSGVPRGYLMNAVEAYVLYVRDSMVYPIMGKETGRNYLPFILTLFTFLLVCNFLGLIPTITLVEVPGTSVPIYPSSTPTGNPWINIGLASMVLVLGIIGGIKEHGFFGYLGSFVPHGVPFFVAVIVWPLEVFGTLIKHAVLAVRLLANMVAGHAVLFGILGAAGILFGLVGSPLGGWPVSLVPVMLGLLIYAVEVLVAIIQAYVFTLLSVIFLDMQIAGH